MTPEGKEAYSINAPPLMVEPSSRPEDHDFSHDPRFTEAWKHQTYVGPMYMLRDSVPHVDFAIARWGPRSGVTSFQLSMKWMWHIIDSIRVGKTGYAYVVDEDGRLIAARDKGKLLRYTRVLAALNAVPDWTPGQGMTFDDSPSGSAALSVYAVVPMLGWKVFVESPIAEAQAPLWHAVVYVGGSMGLGLLAIILASLAARRGNIATQPART